MTTKPGNLAQWLAPLAVSTLLGLLTLLHWGPLASSAGGPLALLSALLSVGVGLLVHRLGRATLLARRAAESAAAERAARERAEQAQRAAEARHASVFHTVADGLLVLNHDKYVVEANRAAGTLHGGRQEALIGRHYGELLAAEHKHLYREFERQLQQFGSVQLAVGHSRSDGSTVDLEVHGTELSAGSESEVLVTLRDVSDRQLAVQQHAMLSRQVLMAQEEERARVSRELHDELGQILTALHLELDWLRKRSGGSAEQATQAFHNAIVMVERAADQLRLICRGLRPPLLDDLGLEPAVRLLIEEFEERNRIKTELQVQLGEAERPLSPEVALCTYRILQEALHNIGRHAEAREASITLGERDGELLLSVYDDGKGFDVGAIKLTKGYGIAGMRERASLVKGTIDIRSESFQGTRVIFRAPLALPLRKEDHDQDPGRR